MPRTRLLALVGEVEVIDGDGGSAGPRELKQRLKLLAQRGLAAALRGGDAQDQGPAGAGLRAVLPQLRLAPEEDGQVVLEDAAPAAGRTRGMVVRGGQPCMSRDLGSKRARHAEIKHHQQLFCEAVMPADALSPLGRTTTAHRVASRLRSLLRGQQLANRLQAQVGNNLAAQLQPASHICLHLRPIYAAAGQQRRGANEVCGWCIRTDGVWVEGEGDSRVVGSCSCGGRLDTPEAGHPVSSGAPTNSSSTACCAPLAVAGVLASGSGVATLLAAAAAAVAGGLPPPSCLCSSALMPVIILGAARERQALWAVRELWSMGRLLLPKAELNASIHAQRSPEVNDRCKEYNAGGSKAAEHDSWRCMEMPGWQRWRAPQQPSRAMEWLVEAYITTTANAA